MQNESPSTVIEEIEEIEDFEKCEGVKDGKKWNPRHREWAFTLNNYTDEIYNKVMELKDNSNVRYGIVARETGRKLKGCEKPPFVDKPGVLYTPHLQGFLYYKNAVFFDSLRKQLPGANLSMRYKKSTAEKASAYCKEEDPDFVEWGELPEQGKRTDIETVRELVVKENLNLREIMMHDNVSSLQHISLAKEYLKYFEQKRDFMPNIIWHFGKTGSRKTSSGWVKLGGKQTAYTPTTAKWWEGYDKHEYVLIDEYRKDYQPLETALRMFDENPFTVECKNGSRQLLAKTILITSPYHPASIYEDSGEDVGQFLRRINECWFYEKIVGKTTEYKCTRIYDDRFRDSEDNRAGIDDQKVKLIQLYLEESKVKPEMKCLISLD